jgi:hypothetical protein
MSQANRNQQQDHSELAQEITEISIQDIEQRESPEPTIWCCIVNVAF